MKGSILLIVIIVFAIFISGIFLYYFFTQEETKIKYPDIPSIPKYSDIIFSPISSTPGELPTKYLDLNKEDYFGFRYTIKSSFADETKVRICPYISYTTKDSEMIIAQECQEVLLRPNEEKVGEVSISLKEKKEEIKDSRNVFMVVNITYSSNIRGISYLLIESGYPSYIISKNSEVEIVPLISPNPIKLEKDKSLFFELEIKKFGKNLLIKKIEIKPLETKIIRKVKDKKIEETISISGECKLEKEIDIQKPKDIIRVCELPTPNIEVKEEKENKNATLQYFNLKCDDEITKKLKICEVLEKEKKTELLRKIPIFLNVSFSASKNYSYRLFLLS
jgi:hypothetical protein